MKISSTYSVDAACVPTVIQLSVENAEKLLFAEGKTTVLNGDRKDLKEKIDAAIRFSVEAMERSKMKIIAVTVDTSLFPAVSFTVNVVFTGERCSFTTKF